VCQTELAGIGIHHRDEAGDRAVTDVVGQVVRGVVGAGQHHRHEQVADGHPLPTRESDLGVGRSERIARIGEHLAHRGVLKRDQRRHQLGRAGDRELGRGALAVQLLTGVLGDERGGAHAERRWRERDGRGRAQREGAQDRRQS
jgi:hypothetical protein